MRTYLTIVGLSAAAIAVYVTGAYKPVVDLALHRHQKTEQAVAVAPPAVTVTKVVPTDFVEEVRVTGSLVAREEILVAPEVEGLRVKEIRVEVGDVVKAGDVLAVLETETLDAQLAQNAAALARSKASIAQAKAQIASFDAQVTEAKAQLERAKPLTKSGYLSDSVFDQRNALLLTAEAQRNASRAAEAAAQAEQGQIEAQRREIEWRRSRAEIRAPADGIISSRNARLGAIATAVGLAAGDQMFRIIQNGEIELDAEVAESELKKIKTGQTARVSVAGGATVDGKVRLIASEVDRLTRLGRVRIFLGADPSLKTGTFASGIIETARSRGLGLPVSAVSTGVTGTTAQVLAGDKVSTRTITTGLATGGMIEIREGLVEGETVIARAGTFLRDGDVVRPVMNGADKMSAAQ